MKRGIYTGKGTPPTQVDGPKQALCIHLCSAKAIRKALQRPRPQTKGQRIIPESNEFYMNRNIFPMKGIHFPNINSS